MLVYLLNQSLQIVRFGIKKQGFDNSYVENLAYMHDFFSGDVMHYNGDRERIVIVKNDDNGYAIMLPSDLTTLEN